ncbi:sulfolactaldehyde 3-reductase [Grimontia marina]|uniref:3-hydroxyisobutyrate dehydrogenase n=1 Tax=Grimontia marina TaxID=646534 RepID=A0A128F9L7_9GAMM|nr:sulfolactaldehyde 3-reductase [Grimontia marina]CZF82996.1 3-hydroxyisobutyrate dehydrogenase [Grimontia marina]
MKNQIIGMVGLGAMGGPIAANLVKAGFSVKVFDLSDDAVSKLTALGAGRASSAAEAARDANVVITMLPNGPHVESAVFGENGIVTTISTDALYIDMSTIQPQVTDSIATRLAEKNISMIDAPVGRQTQHAIEGKLLIMVGGSEDNFKRALPVLNFLGDTIYHCGDVGAGGRMKVVNNYMSIVLNQVTAEALVMAEAAGLDVSQSLEVMRGTVAGQGHMSTTYPSKVLKGDTEPGFMVDLANKDLGLALEMSASLGVPAFTGAVARQVYSLASREGFGRQDWTALYQYNRLCIQKAL